MRYSVYNHTAKVYDYFEGPGPSGSHAGAPPVRTGNKIGPTPDQAAWPLPASSRKVGSGELAQGRIATLGSDGGTPAMPGGVVGYGIVGYVLWRIFR